MTDAKIISGARIFDGEMWHDGKSLVVQHGKVTAISASAHDDAETIDATGLLIVPGFVDVQVNGGGGVMFNNRPDVDGITRICAAHARFGTTALMVTLITDSPDITVKAVEAGIAAQETDVPGFLGLHLEGPHLSSARKGTHDPALIRPMEEKDLHLLLSCKQRLSHILTTIAPESVSTAQVTSLAQAGIIVSLGHSDATYVTAAHYADAGASMVTHLFNAMSQLGNREPGLVGAGLHDNRFHCGMIADGFHVDPVSMALALKAKNQPGRIFLVTDAMSTIGTDDTGLELNGRHVYRKDGRLTLADGTLAGADIDMLSCIRFAHERIGLPLEEALRMASMYPAQAIKAETKGSLLAGYDADFVILNRDLSMKSTWIAGSPVFHAAA
ncbi:N-acetylglucosamine-6-phosphate deacetylase [Rhizobium skierniewicense]|uniref:N-acetylglucosamine-6-phosphate deacetylase n=1 Tax=Rhizobium skierniewicense TaxID=984260 RepID=A0A7W6C9L5_9HYPH|nr:N-acetylglucosamine-6-phosphate deacetylase [Rhizobium skierniewicense]MBB3944400.1 N-acetylglucosamine-6-phosphate deacetylase [Rhizobium skierniewicense]NTF33669.1 N-acetylglucosamine-6-phosphate deacetylase [Rhizobium skierniewicense]